jgi:endoglucanase
MQTIRYAKQVAFFLPAAILVACAADTGDAAKTGPPQAVTQVPGSSSSAAPSSGAGSGSSGEVFTPSSSSSSSGTSSAASGDAGASSGSGQAGTGTDAGTSSSGSSISGPSDAASDTASSSTPPADGSVTDAVAPCTSCKIELKYASDNPTGTGSATFEIELDNLGTTALDLSTVTVNYYFTANGLSGFQFEVYTASVNNAASSAYRSVAMGDVSGAVQAFAPATATADSVLVISFAGAGSIPVGEFIQFKGALHESSYSPNFKQTDDYSFNAKDTTLTDNADIVVDLGGTAAWGTAP